MKFYKMKHLTNLLVQSFLFCLFLSSLLFSEVIKIKESFTLNLLPINKEAFALWKQEFAPPEIYEGFNGELIINRFAYLQICSSQGNGTKLVGSYGQGPGEFYGIGAIQKANDSYFILDPLQGTLSIFNKDFTFQRRLLLFYEGVSNVIQGISVNGKFIATAQYRRQILKNGTKTRAINIYDINGKWQKALFEIDKFQKKLKNYPETLLRGHVLLDGQDIYFCFTPINCIWKINFQGEVLKEKWFGQKWWKYIKYDLNEKKKFTRRKPAWIYDIQAEETGYRIMAIFKYRDYLGLQISKDANNLLDYCYILLDKNFSWESEQIYLADFFPAGYGENCLYLAKMIEFKTPYEESKAKILKCTIEK
ncbi:MAG TPA: hypothetical protein ENO29_05185 [Candidatus Aminicenantes bacterium]|nr:hypothetical protein [Candidatus Aminicenantes bacterium]